MKEAKRETAILGGDNGTNAGSGGAIATAVGGITEGVAIVTAVGGTAEGVAIVTAVEAGAIRCGPTGRWNGVIRGGWRFL